jgi:hypothetical protein
VTEEQVAPKRRPVEWLPVRSVDAARDDQEVRRACGELLVTLDVQRVGGGLPNDLVDPNPSAAEADEEDGLARDRRDVDRPRERDRDPRLDVEAVQRVDDVDVGAIVGARRAVRRRQVDAEGGGLRQVELGEQIAGERLLGADGG